VRFPEEVVAATVIPTIRSMMARELLARGLRESEIGRLLGVSQAAVSKYRRGKVRLSERILNDGRVAETVRGVSRDLARGESSEFEALARLMTLIRELENRGPVCALHEDGMPSLAGLGCDLCITAESSTILEEQEVLGALRSALVALADMEDFALLIPNVGSNLGMARRGAADLTDVAAVPGRIYQLRGVVKVPAPPEFGTSRHVAEVILAVVSYDEEMRSALNVIWDEAVLEASEACGFVTLEMAPSHEGRRDEIGRILGEAGVPDVLFHRGDFGIEPISYILGTEPLESVGKVRRLLEVRPRPQGER
jgi:predicted fused transcriptional regulator/phosphomethylpyrimidine kinase/predicted transcriptional regulator